jgi:enoyl-[acyl-carrier protein] reductase I
MLTVDLRGKKAFIAGIGDDRGFGWAIAKALATCGCDILVGTWPPMMTIFTGSLANGKFEESKKLGNGSTLSFRKIYPFDALYDTPDDVPQEIRDNKRYKELSGYTISEVAASVKADFGTIDYFVHSLANAPEIQKPLLGTSRAGYLAAISASTYSFTSIIKHFGPLMAPGGAFLTLSFHASQQVIPGYGGGMSGAKAALESDTRTLAYEAGRAFGVRVNCISAGAYGSRAARAIGFIDTMIEYSAKNSPLGRAVRAEEVGSGALFLLSEASSGMTGNVVYIDCGLHTMGVALDSASFAS